MTIGRSAYLGVAVLGLAASLAIAADALPLREITVALFLATGPGLAMMRLAGVADRVALLALIVPISLSIDALIAATTLYLGIWSPELVMALIVILTVGAIALAPYERSARAALILIALLPAIVMAAGQSSIGTLT